MIVVILGMHRAGTSMLSSMVHAMRINMGPEIDLKRYDPYSQPHGYWEDQGFISINRQIIKAAGGHWHSPPGRLKILTASIEFRSQINKLIWKRRKVEKWGWKDPRNCLCIEAYQYVLSEFENVRYIQIVRDKDAVTNSLIKREGRTKNWSKIIREHERRTRDFFNRYEVRRHVISYEDILANPRYEIRRLGEFLNVYDPDLVQAAIRRIKH